MHTSISRLLLLLVGFSGVSGAGALGGCATSGGTGVAGSRQARPELEATRIEVCEPFGRDWEVQGNAQAVEGVGGAVVTLHVRNGLCENGKRLFVDTATMLLHTVAGAFHQLLDGPRRRRHANHGTFSCPRLAMLCSAGKIFLNARSPVMPKNTSASERSSGGVLWAIAASGAVVRSGVAPLWPRVA